MPGMNTWQAQLLHLFGEDPSVLVNVITLTAGTHRHNHHCHLDYHTYCLDQCDGHHLLEVVVDTTPPITMMGTTAMNTIMIMLTCVHR